MNKLFVYGTLREGHGNYSRYLKGKEGILCFVEDHALLDLGWFPGMVEESGDRVVGELFEVTDQELHAIDRLEGVNKDNPEHGMYRREVVDVVHINDKEATPDVYTYIYNTDPNRIYNRVPDGDWNIYSGRGTHQ